ncbi:26319_t:CDS:2 [Gigaspora margarita]|uniref:26319_t:CDS:1 n=1 Tax=Gigaspora margarita TaxID=4874 RepID=A0ABN7VMY5_GIGMA|nr:26319_t:CDS:2 [Gigaspora margarita]
MILDIHVDNKNDNIKENPYQHKEVAVNIIHMVTENQEITHNPLQMDQMFNKEKLTTYTLWNLSRLFNNGQVKRLIERYGKVQEIRWTCGKFSKQAHIIQKEKNEKSKKMLKDSWAESKNNPTQQKGTETSSRYKSKIKEKKATRFIKKDKNRTGRKILELENYTTMKSKWKHTGKENDNTTKNLNTRRMTHKNNLSNENEERNGRPKNEKKIESSYSSSRAIATPNTERVYEKTQGIPKKEGLESANLKGKEKEHLTDDIENMMKDRFIRINKAKGSRKMKTSEDYQKSGKQESEIDYIWISKKWAAYIIQASTKDMDLVTNTRENNGGRLVHYKEKLERLLLSKIHIDKEISMDEEWDIIQSSIIKAAQTSLPMKKKLAKMLKTEDTKKTDVLQLLRRYIRKLGTFCRRIRKRVLMSQEEKELYKLYKDIEKNYEIDTSCKQIQDTEEKKCNLENI